MIPEIYDRRSIRKYQNKMIPEQDILDIIESGIKAPSSKNRQPWKYIIVQGKEKEEIISASIQNMLLAATEKGIGSLWKCDIYFVYSELCEWLNADGELLAAVAFGYPGESPKERPRKRMEDIIEWR